MSWMITVRRSNLNPIMFPFDKWSWSVEESDFPLSYREYGRLSGYARSRERAFEKAERRIEEILCDRAIAPKLPEIEVRKYVPRRERGSQTGP